MTQAVANRSNTSVAESIEQVLMSGNLKGLTPEQRVVYHNRVCESLGLNPFTRPFDYLELNGKTVLYARKDATDQLRGLRGISITGIRRETVDGLYIVTVTAQTKDGRTDEALGVVNTKGLVGENLANALMKAETKAKRRVTLSISGLGIMDETEAEDAAWGDDAPPVREPFKRPQSRRMEEPAPITVDVSTGEVEPNWDAFWADARALGLTEPKVRDFVGVAREEFDAFTSHDLDLLMADLRKAHPQPALPA